MFVHDVLVTAMEHSACYDFESFDVTVALIDGITVSVM